MPTRSLVLTLALCSANAATAAPLFPTDGTASNLYGANCRRLSGDRLDHWEETGDTGPIKVFVEHDFAAELNSCLPTDGTLMQNNADPTSTSDPYPVVDETQIRRLIRSGYEQWNLESRTVALEWGGIFDGDMLDSDGMQGTCEALKAQAGGSRVILFQFQPHCVIDAEVSTTICDSSGWGNAPMADGTHDNLKHFDAIGGWTSADCEGVNVVMIYGSNLPPDADTPVHAANSCSTLVNGGTQTKADGFRDWSLNDPTQMNLFKAAIHESGHLFGLAHRDGSSVEDSLTADLSIMSYEFDPAHLFLYDRDCVDDSDYLGERNLITVWQGFDKDGNLGTIGSSTNDGMAQGGRSAGRWRNGNNKARFAYYRDDAIRHSLTLEPGDGTIEWSATDDCLNCFAASAGDGVAMAAAAPVMFTGKDALLGHKQIMSYSKVLGDGFDSSFANLIVGLDTESVALTFGGASSNQTVAVEPPPMYWAASDDWFATSATGVYSNSSGVLYSYLPMMTAWNPAVDRQIFMRVDTGFDAIDLPNAGRITIYPSIASIGSLSIVADEIELYDGTAVESTTQSAPGWSSTGDYDFALRTSKQPGVACLDDDDYEFNCMVAWVDMAPGNYILYTYFKVEDAGSDDSFETVTFGGGVHPLYAHTAADVSVGIVNGEFAVAWKSETEAEVSYRTKSTSVSAPYGGGWSGVQTVASSAGNTFGPPSFWYNSMWDAGDDYNSGLMWTEIAVPVTP